MPRQTASEELVALQAEHDRLTPIVLDLAMKLEKLDAVRHKISMAFSDAWRRRDRIDRRMQVLQRKVKECKPCTEAKPKKEKATAKDLIASLTPVQKAALIQALQKMQAEQKV